MEVTLLPFGRQQFPDGVRSAPRVTSGGQNTGFANRNLALGLGPAWLGTRWAADMAERTGDT